MKAREVRVAGEIRSEIFVGIQIALSSLCCLSLMICY